MSELKSELKLTFFNGRKGNIVSRLPSGKIALVNKHSPARPKAGEKWVCRVDFEKERFAVVTPIEKIVSVTITIKKYEKYKCGCKKLLWTDSKTVEVKESEVNKIHKEQDEIAYTTNRYCEQHSKVVQYSCGHKYTDSYEPKEKSEIVNVPCEQCIQQEAKEAIEQRAKELREQEAQILQKIRDLQRTIERLQKEPIINIPMYLERPPIGSGVRTPTKVWGRPKCPYCGSEIPWDSTPEKIIKCQCGAEFEYHSKTEWTEDMFNLGRCYEYKWLVDIKKYRENEEKIKTISTEIQKLYERLKEVSEKIKEVERAVALEIARKYGVNIKHIEWVSERRCKIYYNDTVAEVLDDEMPIVESDIPEAHKTVISAVFYYLW